MLNPEVDVCVLIPCYNNLGGLLKSLQSISYPLDKLCVVVVDDGSSIKVQEELLPSFNETGFRIYVVRLPHNQGITKALNAGLQWISNHLKPRYIARLDCGDTCQKERFYKQVTFLDQNPGVGLLGTWCIFQNPDAGFKYTYTTPTSHAEIISEMYFRNVFIHPTVMFRAELIKVTGGYSLDYPFVEDYALFFEMLHKTNGAILDEFLVICELNPNGISMSNRRQQLQGRQKVVSVYGSNSLKKLLGTCKLLGMRIIPYKLVLLLKNKVSK
ncbi:glycosyltransferase [Rufibacter latericius]|uniref:glycosyltransferase n=1 Tax=Rufibacter latericius TaxID=2487040 RepID=UPI001403589E|nr:glycosyltransferase [Rufibacter latericius]